MKASELSIGDWVKVLNYYWDGSPYIGQVNGIVNIRGTYSLQFVDALSTEIDMCVPIPLTPEILEKNGFNVKEEDETHTKYVRADGNSIISFAFLKETIYGVDTVFEGEFGFVGGLDRIHHCHIKYVHELQHALRLAGVKKDVVV